MKHKVILYALTIAATLFSCGDSFDKALCGEPEGKQSVNRAEFHVYDKKGKLIRGNRGSM
jgi:hypothetical protein